jgi:hypothetical protein
VCYKQQFQRQKCTDVALRSYYWLRAHNRRGTRLNSNDTHVKDKSSLTSCPVQYACRAGIQRIVLW